MMMNHEKNHIFLVAIILLILNVAFATPSPNNMKWPELSSDYNPIADPKAVVISNNARFTVLTPYLIRMEYSSSKQFEDRATTAVLNRETTVPEFTQSISKDGKTLTIEITSSKVTLSYQIGQEFSTDTLSITSKDFDWKYGDVDSKNLLGTIKSLDLLNAISLDCREIEEKNITVHDESLHCQYGLISRSGWSVVDDSDTYVLNPKSGWWDQGQNADEVDLYMFAHGHAYKSAIQDFVEISGKTAMVPRAASGLWWTRWFNLNTQDLENIVEEYKSHALPLDVFVLDMDWHKKNEWGGYTWDPNLFPYPNDSMNNLLKGKYNLVTVANIHDDNGVGNYEAQFNAMAKAMGIDPSSTDNIPFQFCNNETYTMALEDEVLKPVEDSGMDYWWIDWQQGGTQGGCAGLKQNPTIWTNKIRVTDPIRRDNQNKRGMVLARWGGLGSHRYQVGFSGDVAVVNWTNLAYQPYFSSTATNVAYGFWSHDIVGPNSGGGLDFELYTRWIQWGAFSGVFRSHDRGMSGGNCAQAFPSTIDNNHCGVVRPWNVPLRYFKVNRAAMQRRAAMVPYFYTLVREAYDTGLGPLRPMYYEFPEHDEAYLSDMKGNFAQYFYGNDMFVAPVIEPANEDDSGFTGLTSKQVWVPPGSWVEKDRSLVVQGPTTITRNYALEEIPQFIRVGAMIPTLPHVVGDTIGKAGEMYKAIIWTIYLGDNMMVKGKGSFYEDDGTTMKYLQQSSAPTTTASFEHNQRSLEFVVNSSTEKQWTLKIVNSLLPKSITVGGKTNIPYSRFPSSGSWSWDGATGELVVNIPEASQTVTVSILWQSQPLLQDGMNGVQGAVFLSTIAKHALDQVRQSVGSQTGQVGYGGALDILAGSGQTLAYEAGLTDSGKTFFAHLNNMKTLVSNAMVEVKNITLPGGDDGIRRLAYVENLMNEVEACL